MKRPFSPDTPPTRYDREDFRRQVYQVVRAIPRGRVLSYGGIARLIGHPSRARAVGTALKNAPEGIPCHRVVGTNGSLTGYAGGLDRKIKLLEIEQTDMHGLFRPKKGTAI